MLEMYFEYRINEAPGGCGGILINIVSEHMVWNNTLALSYT